MVKIYVAIICFLLSFCEVFALTKEEFQVKMRGHVQRVQLLGLEVYDELLRRFPREFSSLSRADVLAFLQLHDKTKLDDSLEFLKKHNLFERPNIPENLASFYGLSKEQLAALPSQFFKQGNRGHDLAYIVSLLNKSDDEIANNFFRRISPDKKQKLLMIEKVSDLVDTAFSRRGEFDHEVMSASSFLKKGLKEGHFQDMGEERTRLLDMANYLEEKGVDEIISNQMRNESIPSCGAKILKVLSAL